MTRSRARQNREERAARCEAHTLAMRSARARQSHGERADTNQVHTLAMRSARARQSHGERADTRQADTMARRSARARQSHGERADTRQADTMARRSARARQSHGERADTNQAHTLAMRSARARQSQTERADTRQADTMARRTARARQTQQQASTPEWSRLPVLHRPNPAAIQLGHEHQCSHCNARLLSEENESFCCRDGKVAITPLHPLPEGWEEMFRMPTFRYDGLCVPVYTLLTSDIYLEYEVYCHFYNSMCTFLQGTEPEV